MRVQLALLPFLLFLPACNRYHLRYQANPQPSGGNLYADYTPLKDSVGILLDTDGRRLQEVSLTTANGTSLRPVSIAYPAFGKDASIGVGVGFGVPVGVGTGVGIPIGPDHAQGLTTATFPQQDLGPAPWTLHLKVDGLHEATIPGIGGPATAK